MVFQSIFFLVNGICAARWQCKKRNKRRRRHNGFKGRKEDCKGNIFVKTTLAGIRRKKTYNQFYWLGIKMATIHEQERV